LFYTAIGIILIIILSVQITSSHDANSVALGLEFSSTGSDEHSITNFASEIIIMPLSSNLTNSTNSSNVTNPNSNLTNRSSNLNITIPGELPPESVNGSKIGKI
jgi:hypothetical protein